MKSLFSQALVTIFILTSVALPQLTLAQEATPVVPESTETPAATEASNPGTPAPDGDSQLPEPAAQIPATPGPDSQLQGDVVPLGELTENYGITGASWNSTTNELSVDLFFFPAFVAEEGDTIEVFYSSDSLSIAPGQHQIGGSPIVAEADNASEVITLTFTAPYGPVGGAVTMVLPGEVHFPVCGPSSSAYTPSANIVLYTASYYPFTFMVEGPECPAAEGAVVTSVGYTPVANLVAIQLGVSPGGVVAGTQITVTYPADVMSLEPGPVEFYALETGSVPVPVVIATGVANNGLITITFEDYVPDPDNPLPIEGHFESNLITATCDPNGGLYTIELDRIVFVANPGGSFYSQLPTSTEGGFRNEILCNAAPASKSGELSADGTQVFWTIDTGHLLDGAMIQDSSLITSQTFLCDTVLVTTEPANLDPVVECYGDGSGGFSVFIQNEGITRATITFTTEPTVSMPGTPVVNCAFVSAGIPFGPVQAQRSAETDGVGATVCAQVFSEGDGDFITITPSATEVYANESLTYDVTFSTTTALWWSIPLNIQLPAGFEPTNVECSFDPAPLAEGDCAILDDGTISVGLRRVNGVTEPVDPGSIAVSITGTVSAAPGTELVINACGERRLDVPSSIGTVFLTGLETGPICDTASTMVLQVPAETPTPSPTPSPTPTGTIEPSPTPTETQIPTSTPTITPPTPATETPAPTATTAPEHKQTVVRVETADNSSLEGTAWSLYAPVASQVPAGPYLTGVLDANNSALMVDVPAGEYRFVVSPAGMAPQEFILTITNESQEIVVQLASEVTPGATATSPAEPTATSTSTSAVTGLPETGGGSTSSGGAIVAILSAALGAVALMLLGMRMRTIRK